MTPDTAHRSPGRLGANRDFFIGLARAAGGAILFSLPMMMTMEMWYLGFYMDPLKMGLSILIVIPLFAGLSYYSGFENPVSTRGALVDAFVAYAVGFAAAAAVLALLAVVETSMAMSEVLGKITLQAIPGGIGAVLAASQLGGTADHASESDESSSGNEPSSEDKPSGLTADAHQSLRGYFRELLLMVAGALFLAFNVAPTEEMVLVAYKMTSWHAIALTVVSILVMHAFVYVAEFRGQETFPEKYSGWSVFLRFTITGYAIALLISLYCLWIFGRTTDTGISQIAMINVVLAFPSAIGAAAARLIL